MDRQTISKGQLFLLPIAAALLSVSAQSLELNSTIGSTVEHTDNGLKSENNERSELESKLWLTIGARHQGPSLDLALDYRFDRLWYKHDTQEDQSTIEGNTNLRWEILNERFYLDVAHSRRNILQDSAQLDVQDNREDRDVTQVTPSYVLRFGGADTVTIAGTFTDVRYEDRDDRDSQRYGGRATWSHGLSEVDNLLLEISSTEVENESEVAGDYRYDSVTIGYGANLSKLSYTILVGANRIERDDNRDDVDGGLVDITADYRSGFQVWSLTAHHGITDSSFGNGNNVLEDFYRYDSSFNEVDILEETSVQLDWSSTGVCSGCTVNVGAFYEKEDYEEQPDDNQEWGVELGFRYQVTRLATAGIIYRYRDLSFDDNNLRDDYDINEVRLIFDQRLGQRLRAGVFVAAEQRNSDTGAVDYDVLSGGLTISYDLL